MRGAEAIVRTLIASGVDLCLANPGTSEMHLVAALDAAPQIKPVLGLTEGVVTGAADGYARMAGKPAATLLHCGPGLANGLSNLHNARRARVPVVNLVGDQATYHAPLDPPLASEVENLARVVSGWTRTSRSPHQVGRDVAAAVAGARDGDQIATLVLPSDACWSDGAQPAAAPGRAPRIQADAQALQLAADLLRQGQGITLWLGGAALHGEGLSLAGRIAGKTGARLMAPSANARIQRGSGRPLVQRLPYAADRARAALAPTQVLCAIGAAAPVAFFAYPDKSSALLDPQAQVLPLVAPGDDVLGALAMLAQLVEAGRESPRHAAAPAVPAQGAASAAGLAQSLAALLPHDAIVVDESVSVGRELFARTADAEPHDWLQLTGGAIGDGLPMATGAALAAPGRRVVNLQADGSAMYSVQALWTQAKHRLSVTTIILSNRKYATLFDEMRNVGAQAGDAAQALFDLGDPAVDWCRLSTSLGVEAAVAGTMEEFNALFSAACARPGPMLIELRL